MCPAVSEAYIHYITLHYITLHYITLHYITLRYVTLRYITLHYITLHYITSHHITSPYITLHYITLPYITHIHTYIHTYIFFSFLFLTQRVFPTSTWCLLRRWTGNPPETLSGLTSNPLSFSIRLSDRRQDLNSGPPPPELTL